MSEMTPSEVHRKDLEKQIKAANKWVKKLQKQYDVMVDQAQPIFIASKKAQAKLDSQNAILFAANDVRANLDRALREMEKIEDRKFEV